MKTATIQPAVLRNDAQFDICNGIIIQDINKLITVLLQV